MLSLVLSRLASPRLSVAFFIVAGLSALGVAKWGLTATALMWLPLGLLVANLSAAILVNPRFRADLPLLLFHLALLALVTLIAVGRLTYLEGRIMLPQGATFEGTFDAETSGPLHGDGFRSLRFVNAGLAEVYPKRGDFRQTYNSVMWPDAANRPMFAEIGDDKPLVLNGYRIFTSANRGVSPVFRFEPKGGGAAEHGTVLLRHSLDSAFESGTSWRLPDGEDAWVALIASPNEKPHREGEQIDMGVYQLDHALILRVNDIRREIRLGETVDLPGGRLTYEKLVPWMGYRVAYDMTLPWIVGSVGLGVISLVWFYIGRVFSRPLYER